ncbi:unnamed protein product [Ophioblennius macclurei]
MNPLKVNIRIVTITQVLLLTLICWSIQDGQEQIQEVLQCGPENVSLSSSDQTLLLTWDDEISCSLLQHAFIYEVEVFIATRRVHHDKVSVTSDSAGRRHSWNWTSHLSLHCASHSVRLRSRYNNQTSVWKQEQIVPGTQHHNAMRIFPRDGVFRAGSQATFCCIVPAGQRFDSMYLNNYNSVEANTSKIDEQTYSLTLILNQTSEVCIDVKCKTNAGSFGACTYIGYPPDDHNLECETQDLNSVDCSWMVGRPTNLSLRSPTRYQLLGRPCERASERRCSQTIQFGAEERNWTLTAQNILGTVELHDRADLTKRVRMFAPVSLAATTVNSRNVSLTWTWTVEQYRDLNITCQTHVSDAETSVTVENYGTGLNIVVVSGLIPHWTYSVKVRCGTAQHFWRWGDWSKSLFFQTHGDVPEALNVWTQMKGNQTLVLWKKLLANQSHGEIIDYNVTWAKSGDEDLQITSKVPIGTENISLSLNSSKEHVVTVTARNRHGSSSPSTIIIPSVNPGEPAVSTSWISGASEGFTLSWPAHPAASCGYTVDWRVALGTGPVDWLRVPPNETSVSIVSKDFRDGVRYLLSVYACTHGAPVLLQRNEGYVRETRIEDNLFKSLKLKEQGSDVEISWDPIPLRGLTAFIRGYALHYQDHSSSPLTVSTDDPHATSLMVRRLKKALYTFTVTAVTSMGECGNASITATLSSQADNLIWSVFITLGVIFSLLSFTTVICYRQWACIKQKVYPEIPKPVLTEKITSPSQYFVTDQCLHPEADILDVPELLYSPGESQNDYVSHEDLQTAFTQTLTDLNINNEHLDRPTPPIVLSTAPQVDFSNPSYNLALDAETEPKPGPEVQTETESPDGYQPQSRTENVSSAQIDKLAPSRITLISAYVSLPSTEHIHACM